VRKRTETKLENGWAVGRVSVGKRGAKCRYCHPAFSIFPEAVVVTIVRVLLANQKPPQMANIHACHLYGIFALFPPTIPQLGKPTHFPYFPEALVLACGQLLVSKQA